MADATSGNPVEGVVDEIEDVAEAASDTVSVHEVLHGLGERSFGPILLVASLAMILPIGMVPGVPAVIGAVLAVAGWQLLKGDEGIRLPGLIAERRVSTDLVERSAEKARPWARRAGKLFGHRWEGLTQSHLVLHVGGAVVMVIGAVMIALGAIPGLPAALALPVAIYGLGLTANNGLLVLAAGAILVPAVAALAWIVPWPPWAFLPGLG